MRAKGGRERQSVAVKNCPISVGKKKRKRRNKSETDTPFLLLFTVLFPWIGRRRESDGSGEEDGTVILGHHIGDLPEMLPEREAGPGPPEEEEIRVFWRRIEVACLIEPPSLTTDSLSVQIPSLPPPPALLWAIIIPPSLKKGSLR